MYKSIFGILFLCTCASSAPQATVAPVSSNNKVFRKDYRYDQSTRSFYKFHKIPLIFQEAVTTCKYEGAELAVPKTEADAGVLKSFMSETSSAIWVALHDIYAEGEFVTLNGTSIDEIYQVWNTGEPNNVDNDEDCVTMEATKSYNDVPCGYKFQYICRKKEEDIHFNYICESFDKDYFYKAEGDRCYKLHTTPKTWHQAFKICHHEEAKLAVINSATEAKMLTDHINLKHPLAYLRDNFDRHNIFVDFSDLITPGVYQTSDGVLLADTHYDEWAPGQPDNQRGMEHCGSMYRDGKLNDLSCNSKTMFFCEKVLGPPFSFTLVKRTGYHD